MNDVKDTLLHAVSHDLKGPLAGILGAMQTIRRDDELHLTADEREALYEVIEHSGRKMNRLIDDLLDLDRIDRGKLHPQREPTDVGELARRVGRRSRQLDGHPVRVRGRRRAGRGRSGQGRARHREPARERRPPHARGHRRCTSTSRRRPTASTSWSRTTGPGVPDELKDVLFEPFRQGEGSSGRGMGIGLSLVQRFAELHGGSAHVEDARERRRALRGDPAGRGHRACRARTSCGTQAPGRVTSARGPDLRVRARRLESSPPIEGC